MPKPLASEQEENVRFTRMVRQYPCLYDTNGRYSYRVGADDAWKIISAEFKAPVQECKIRWKNIRTVFRRHCCGGVGPSPKKEYYLSEELKFLLPTLGVRKHRDDLPKFNDDEPEMEQNDSESDDPTTSLVPSEPPIPITDLQESHTEDQDMHSVFNRTHSRDLEPCEPVKTGYNLQHTSISDSNYGGHGQDALADKSDELFLLSLKDDMRRMSSIQKRKFKRRIFDIIDEVLVDGEPTPTTEHLAPQSIIKIEENQFQTDNNMV